jgi:hypothetical protein
LAALRAASLVARSCAATERVVRPAVSAAAASVGGQFGGVVAGSGGACLRSTAARIERRHGP